MVVNHKPVVVEGKSFIQIGRMLKEASPKKDGVGLRVLLNTQEEGILERHFESTAEAALVKLVTEAVVKAGGQPNGFSYTYAKRLFITVANA